MDGFLITAQTQVGAVEAIGLPEVVGVGFGEGEAAFRTLGGVGLEEVEVVDHAAQGVGCDLAAMEVTLLDAGTVECLNVEGGRCAPTGALAEGWERILDGGQDVFGSDFADGAFVGAAGCFGDAVFAVVIPLGLDGAPSEASRVSVFIVEDHF